MPIVIEIRGGCLCDVYADESLDVILVDWDNIAEGDSARRFDVAPLSEMPAETLKAVDHARAKA